MTKVEYLETTILEREKTIRAQKARIKELEEFILDGRREWNNPYSQYPLKPRD